MDREIYLDEEVNEVEGRVEELEREIEEKEDQIEELEDQLEEKERWDELRDEEIEGFTENLQDLSLIHI